MSEGRKSEAQRLHEMVFVDKYSKEDCESGKVAEILKKEGYPDYSIRRLLAVMSDWNNGYIR